MIINTMPAPKRCIWRAAHGSQLPLAAEYSMAKPIQAVSVSSRIRPQLMFRSLTPSGMPFALVSLLVIGSAPSRVARARRVLDEPAGDVVTARRIAPLGFEHNIARDRRGDA